MYLFTPRHSGRNGPKDRIRSRKTKTKKTNLGATHRNSSQLVVARRNSQTQADSPQPLCCLSIPLYPRLSLTSTANHQQAVNEPRASHHRWPHQRTAILVHLTTSPPALVRIGNPVGPPSLSPFGLLVSKQNSVPRPRHTRAPKGPAASFKLFPVATQSIRLSAHSQTAMAREHGLLAPSDPDLLPARFPSHHHTPLPALPPSSETVLVVNE